MAQNTEREYIDGPLPIDESWWTAVLGDVEALYADIDREEIPGGSVKVTAKENLPSGNGDDKKEKVPFIEGEPDTDIDWDLVKDLYDRDQVICLKVEYFNKGGLLVRGEDIQGFVPASHLINLSGISSQEDRDDYFSNCVGNSLLLKVIECDQERGRVVLSERAAQTDPGSRVELLKTMCEGDCIQGRVTTITDFGVFVDLGGVEGLIHISELSWGRVCHPDSVISIGDDISVKVLGIDKDKSRVALSFKRLHPNPWETVNDRYHLGEITGAVITNIVSFGAFARLEDGLDGLIHVSEFRKQGCDQEIRELYSEGQHIEVSIINIDPNQQRLGLGLPDKGDGGM